MAVIKREWGKDFAKYSFAQDTARINKYLSTHEEGSLQGRMYWTTTSGHVTDDDADDEVDDDVCFISDFNLETTA